MDNNEFNNESYFFKHMNDKINKFLKNSNFNNKNLESPILCNNSQKKCLLLLQLEISDLYNTEKIQKSYKKLAKIYYPDNKITGNKELFIKITNAKNYLLWNNI